ncbi:hypothetical protein [Clostridium oryzae]|uniref:Uncharacterized protein n=1 Tax=Clostridium oryzae TaxID=1450648 RepID=A0A1V4IZD1_9CLOT|nr:hypothetical protein [Clostridium oryzae]OPJ64777.1 hypothetical protein CLORY_02860 [Clostridium oryzae]
MHIIFDLPNLIVTIINIAIYVTIAYFIVRAVRKHNKKVKVK